VYQPIGAFQGHPAYFSGQFYLFWNSLSWAVSAELGGQALVYNYQDALSPDQLTAAWEPIAVHTVCIGMR